MPTKHLVVYFAAKKKKKERRSFKTIFDHTQDQKNKRKTNSQQAEGMKDKT